jgi:hypothetical protein
MLEQPTASTAAGPGAAARTSRMQAQISAQLPATSKDCEPGMPASAGWDQSRRARAAGRPSAVNRAARQPPVPASSASR